VRAARTHTTAGPQATTPTKERRLLHMQCTHAAWHTPKAAAHTLRRPGRDDATVLLQAPTANDVLPPHRTTDITAHTGATARRCG
jgi:hypothetical protein